MVDTNQPPSPQDEPMDPRKETFLWGMAPLPISDTPANFLAIGGPDSGKTITLRLLMQSALTPIDHGLDHRALVYDFNGAWESVLRGMNLRCPVEVINPTDRHGSAWDIAADITSPSAVQHLAACFIPIEVSSPSFFADAARTLLTAILVSLIHSTPGKWNLGDVLLVLRDRQRLLSLLAQTPEGVAATRSIVGNDHHFSDVMATINHRMSAIETTAKFWQTPTSKVSLQRWLQGESVIVIRDRREPHAPASPIIQAILACASESVLAQKPSNDRRTWICLDDFCRAGRLDTLPTLMVRGRPQGVCVAWSASGAEEVKRLYGPDAAEQVFANCGFKTALRTIAPEDAKWAERHFGPPLGASDLLSMPQLGPDHGFSAFHRTPKAGTYFTQKSWDWVLTNLRPTGNPAADTDHH